MRYKYLFLFWLLVSGIACNKDSIVQNDQKVGISRISYFPVVVTTGSRLVIIQKGGTFTDSGATATVKGVPLDNTASGTVDVNTPGIYMITYTAINSDGFSGTDFRTVVVLDTDISANDFSGTYLRGATGQTSIWTKISDGVYQVDNPGGAGTGYGFDVIVVNYSGTMITIPQQFAFDPTLRGNNLVSSADEQYFNGASPHYQWVLFASGYGTSLRTFVKQ
jgi:hypothetical protein